MIVGRLSKYEATRVTAGDVGSVITGATGDSLDEDVEEGPTKT